MVEADQERLEEAVELDYFPSVAEIEAVIPQLRLEWRFGHLKDAEAKLNKIERSIPKIKEGGSDVSVLEELLEKDPEFQLLRTDLKIMNEIQGQYTQEEGYKIAYDDPKKNMKMWIKLDQDGYITSKFFVQKVEIPLFNLMCVLYETDLYHLWFPFNKAAGDVHVFSEIRKLCWTEFGFPFPFNNRMAQLYGFGINKVKTHNSMVLAVKSVDWDIEKKEEIKEFHGIQIPELGKNHVRMITHYYGFEMKVIGKDQI